MNIIESIHNADDISRTLENENVQYEQYTLLTRNDISNNNVSGEIYFL